MAFAYKAAITIDHTKVPNTDQTDFPVLVSGTYAGAAGVPDLRSTGNGGHIQNSNGYDIQFFSDSSLTTRLPTEREIYNAATGQLIAWVKVAGANLSHTADTVIYIGYGDSGISTDPNSDATYGKTNVWDSNYKQVWHLSDGTSLNLNDSTSNGTTLTNNNTVTPTTGQIDGGANLSSASSQSLSTTVDTSAVAMSYEVWVKPSSFPNAYNTIMGGNAGKFFDMHVKSNGNLALYISGTLNIVDYDGTGSNTLVAGNWYHIAMTYDSTNGLRGYVNGAQDGTAAAAGTVNTGFTYFSLGNDPPFNPRYFNGKIDEARISNTARSADWVSTEYNNQLLPDKIGGASGFYTMGSETSTGGSSGPVGKVFSLNQAINRASTF